MASSILEGVTMRKSESGSEYYTIKYYCPDDSSLSSTEPSKGDLASWAPVTAYVSDIERTPLVGNSAPYILTLSASPGSSGGTSLGYTDSSDFNNYCIRKYKTSEVLIRPEWFGVRKAEKIDETNAIKNLKGDACKKGDYIFINATASSTGTADMTLSPFVSKTVSVTYIDGIVGQKIKTDVFHLEFYSPLDINRFYGFKGVNGRFPNARKPFSTASKTWRALDQKIEEVNEPSSGNVWTKVVRQCERVPLDGFTFDADKNGGTWNWT